MTAREIFEACVGINDMGDPKSITRVSTSIMTRNDMSEEERDEIIINGAVVNIFQSARLSMVSLTFEDPYDTDFISLCSIINEFQQYKNSIDGDAMPVISVSVMPKTESGYYVMGVGGIGVVQPSKAGGANDTVTFIFTNDTIHPYMVDTDTVEKESEEFAGEE